MSKKSWALVALLVLIGSMILVACTGGGETVVEVTRVVTETEVVEQEPEVVEVTRVVETKSKPRTRKRPPAPVAGSTRS